MTAPRRRCFAGGSRSKIQPHGASRKQRGARPFNPPSSSSAAALALAPRAGPPRSWSPRHERPPRHPRRGPKPRRAAETVRRRMDRPLPCLRRQGQVQHQPEQGSLELPRMRPRRRCHLSRAPCHWRFIPLGCRSRRRRAATRSLVRRAPDAARGSPSAGPCRDFARLLPWPRPLAHGGSNRPHTGRSLSQGTWLRATLSSYAALFALRSRPSACASRGLRAAG